MGEFSQFLSALRSLPEFVTSGKVSLPGTYEATADSGNLYHGVVGGEDRFIVESGGRLYHGTDATGDINPSYGPGPQSLGFFTNSRFGVSFYDRSGDITNADSYDSAWTLSARMIADHGNNMPSNWFGFTGAIGASLYMPPTATSTAYQYYIATYGRSDNEKVGFVGAMIGANGYAANNADTAPNGDFVGGHFTAVSNGRIQRHLAAVTGDTGTFGGTGTTDWSHSFLGDRNFIGASVITNLYGAYFRNFGAGTGIVNNYLIRGTDQRTWGTGDRYLIFFEKGANGSNIDPIFSMRAEGGTVLRQQDAAQVGLKIVGATSQAGNLFETRDVSDNPLFVTTKSGNVGVGTATPGNPLFGVDFSGQGIVHIIPPAGQSGIFVAEGAVTPGVIVRNSAASANQRISLLYQDLNGSFGIYQTSDAGAFTQRWITCKPNGSVSIGQATPNAAAKFQIDSTTQGFLPPRMTTTQRDAISSPPEGLSVWNTTLHTLDRYNGTAWGSVIGPPVYTLGKSVGINNSSPGNPIFGADLSAHSWLHITADPLDIAGIYLDSATGISEIVLRNGAAPANQRMIDWFMNNVGTWAMRQTTDAGAWTTTWLQGTASGDMQVGSSLYTHNKSVGINNPSPANPILGIDLSAHTWLHMNADAGKVAGVFIDSDTVSEVILRNSTAAANQRLIDLYHDVDGTWSLRRLTDAGGFGVRWLYGQTNGDLILPGSITANAAGYLSGGSGSGGNLTLQSTSHATRGKIVNNDPVRMIENGVNPVYTQYDCTGLVDAGLLWNISGASGFGATNGFKLYVPRASTGANDLYLDGLVGGVAARLMSLTRDGSYLAFGGDYVGGLARFQFPYQSVGYPQMAVGSNTVQAYPALRLVGYSTNDTNDGGGGWEVGDGSGAVYARFFRTSSNNFVLKMDSVGTGDFTLTNKGTITVQPGGYFQVYQPSGIESDFICPVKIYANFNGGDAFRIDTYSYSAPNAIPLAFNQANAQVGPTILFRRNCSNTTMHEVAGIDAIWDDDTEVTRKGALVASVYDGSTAREALRCEVAGVLGLGYIETPCFKFWPNGGTGGYDAILSKRGGGLNLDAGAGSLIFNYTTSLGVTAGPPGTGAGNEFKFNYGSYLARFFLNAIGPQLELAADSGSGFGPPLIVTPAGNVVVGNAALATNATNGFLYIPGGAGPPTGTPTAFTGKTALYADQTNSKVYAYFGAWTALN